MIIRVHSAVRVPRGRGRPGDQNEPQTCDQQMGHEYKEEAEEPDRADRREVHERELRLDQLRQRMGFAHDERERTDDGRADQHPDGVRREGMRAREALRDDAGLGADDGVAEDGEEIERRRTEPASGPALVELRRRLESMRPAQGA